MKSYIIAFSFIIFMTGCDNNPTPVSNFHQPQNFFKSAKIYEPGGKKPAARTTVTFFDLTEDCDTPKISFTTDDSGTFSIVDLPSGYYVLWAEKDSLVAFQDSIKITADSSSIHDDTLEHACTVHGVVNINTAHDPRNVTIRLRHSDKHVKVTDTSGNFILNGIAQGSFTIQGECSLPDYIPTAEKFAITTDSNYTLKDTIKLIYSGIPIPSQVKLALDTLTSTVHLSWNKVSSQQLQDYVIYKNMCGEFKFSGTILATTKDTFFDDKSDGLKTTHPRDTIQTCISYYIAVRTTTQEIGPLSRKESISIVPKSFVTTFFTSHIQFPNSQLAYASLNDTVHFYVTARNKTRHLVSTQWYDYHTSETIATRNLDTIHTTIISDTLSRTFSKLGQNRIVFVVNDNAGKSWSIDLSASIVSDVPGVIICKDTSVLAGAKVHLYGSAKQQFGTLDRWEWKIGSADWIRTSTADTTITAPLTEQVTICSLAVADDDGYIAKHSMNIVTSFPVQKVEACSSYSFILKTDSTLLAFGQGGSGQLGNGSIIPELFPKNVMSGVQSFSAGKMHSMILRSDGTLWACGDNSFGQLGDGTNTQRNIPVPVMNGVSKVIAGNTHSLILDNTGALWACGDNSSGQLGDSSTVNRNVPVKVMSGVQDMAAGAFHSVILKSDGTVWTCGENGGGQLGIGTTSDCIAPVQITGLNGVQSVAAGGWHSLFLTNTGELWGCGNNGYGQIGDGTIDRRLTPVKVIGDLKAIEASMYYSLLLKKDNTLLICGLNPTSQNSYAPYSIMTNVQNMAAGWFHLLILKTDGTVWACGRNDSGQLGDGTLMHRLTTVCIVPSQKLPD